MSSRRLTLNMGDFLPISPGFLRTGRETQHRSIEIADAQCERGAPKYDAEVICAGQDAGIVREHRDGVAQVERDVVATLRYGGLWAEVDDQPDRIIGIGRERARAIHSRRRARTEGGADPGQGLQSCFRIERQVRSDRLDIDTDHAAPELLAPTRQAFALGPVPGREANCCEISGSRRTASGCFTRCKRA
jgi:hypothetical protein